RPDRDRMRRPDLRRDPGAADRGHGRARGGAAPDHRARRGASEGLSGAILATTGGHSRLFWPKAKGREWPFDFYDRTRRRKRSVPAQYSHIKFVKGGGATDVLRAY